MSSLVWLLLLSYSSLVISHHYYVKNPCSDNAAASSQDKSIFILAGQSNMAGRGGVRNFAVWDRYIPPESQPNPKILRLNANLTWEVAQEPIHKDIDVTKVCGIGPGMPFANSLLEKDASNIGVVGLVPCAIGATNISQWTKGSSDEGGLYDQLIRRARAAVEGGGVIRAMLWYQGEGDSDKLENAESYKGRLDKFFTDVRTDLKLPTLPIIQVALASGGKYKDVVRKGQLEIELGNVCTVDAKGLEISADGVHLTTAAEVQLGKMLADAFLHIIKP